MANIVTLYGEFPEVKSLVTYSNAQFVALKEAIDKIKKLEEEIAHLQQLLASTTPLTETPKVEKIIKSPELVICETQIKILQNRALQKELTLEEVKIFDLLLKNMRLLMGDPTTIEGEKNKNLKLVYSDADLVKIAQKEDKH